MQTWYKAVCDEHKECCTVMVTNPHRTHLYLMDRCQEIQEWLSIHYGCQLRLVHLDEDLDKLWDEYWVAERAWAGLKQYRDTKNQLNTISISYDDLYKYGDVQADEIKEYVDANIIRKIKE